MKLVDIYKKRKGNLFILDRNTLSNINILIGNESLIGNGMDVSVPEHFWEDEFLKLVGRFKYVSGLPTPYISSLNKHLLLEGKSFSSIEDIHSYLDSELGDPVIFSIKKTCNISNLQAGYTYHLRMGFIKDPIEVREDRINRLI